jgi:hypothetical protein
VTGTVISSSAFNALTADLATGLSTAITKDGQTATTVRIPFAQGINSSLTTDTTSGSTGSIYTAGGVGITKGLFVGGTATFSATPIFSALTASSAVATDSSKNLVSVTNTGTGNNVLGTAPTISLPTIDNIKMGYSTTATAAGTTTLTIASNYRQFFTGSTTQTIVLPVTSTLVTGIAYEIENNSTGLLTVNSSGGNLVGTIPAGVCAHAVCIGTTLTTAADWDWDYISTTTITGTGANVLGTSPTLTSPTLASANITTALTLTGSAGTSGQVLTSAGSGAAPTWTSASSAITNGTSNVSISSSNGAITASTNGTSALTIDTSQNLKFNSGYGSVVTAYGCRAWVNFNGTGTVAILASGNVSSITDNAIGQYTVNLTTAMPDINYAITVTQKPPSDRLPGSGEFYNITRTTSSYAVSMGDASSYYDSAVVSSAVFR